MTIALPSVASAYPKRRASKGEVAAIVHDAKRTQVCGYTGGGGHLSAFRVVYYAAHHVLFKWAATTWSPPGGQGCVLVFLHASGSSFDSTQTQRHAQVDWLPFTWGSSPFDNPSYLTSQWSLLGFAAGPPNWSALAAELS